MAATWNDLADEIKLKIQEMTETGEWNVQSVTSLDGLSHTFYSMAELMAFYDKVNSYAQGEEDEGTKPKWRPIAMRRSGFRR